MIQLFVELIVGESNPDMSYTIWSRTCRPVWPPLSTTPLAEYSHEEFARLAETRLARNSLNYLESA